ncbi:serpin family protein [Calidifontibacter terrae]
MRVDAARMAAGPDEAAGSRLTTFGASLLVSDAYRATDNAAISPYSVYSALAMTAAGARGTTATEFGQLLGGDATQSAGFVTAIDQAVAAAVAAGRGSDKAMTINPANTVAVQEDLTLRPEFIKQLAAGFAAASMPVAFDRDAEGARSTINGWVSQKTRRLIPELLGRGTIDSSTRLVLINALYLKAKWQDEFSDPFGATSFTTADGSSVTTPMMDATGHYRLASGLGWKAVQIPYRGGQLAMTIVLPDAGAFAATRRQLPGVLAQATRAGSAQPVDLSMPAFSVDTSAGLADALRGLGLRAAFDPHTADLSGMCGAPGELCVAFVQHQAVVKVDQHGTEAAAATAVAVAATGASEAPTSFVVDRAFFFVIHDTTTNAPLFLGQVVRPER